MKEYCGLGFVTLLLGGRIQNTDSKNLSHTHLVQAFDRFFLPFEHLGVKRTL